MERKGKKSVTKKGERENDEEKEFPVVNIFGMHPLVLEAVTHDAAVVAG